MKNVFPFLLLLIVGCSAPEMPEVTIPETNSNADLWEERAIEMMEDDADENPIIAEAMMDGPDEDFYIIWDDKIPDDRSLHIIPQGSGSDADQIQDYMLAIVADEFNLSSSFHDEFSGKVTVYYNASQTAEVCSFMWEGPGADGIIEVKDPQGTVIINRIYEHGIWKGSSKDLASVSWTFDQEKSALTINDLDQGEIQKDGKREISLMSSYLNDKRYHQDLTVIMEKESFKNAFTINGEPYTGKLTALYNPKGLDLDPYYELNFLNGYLHDTISIYNDWNQLDLQELFVNGELDSVLFKEEYVGEMAKPIIYFYPEKEMDVSVELELKGSITHSYPAYPEKGWNVHIEEDGTITDSKGQTYYSLYWEGTNSVPFNMSSGSVVKGSETVAFLEKALAELGLNRREANEFIIYWLPQLESNPYNFIHFSTSEYEEIASLNITPKPETVIRVMMVFEGLQESKIVPTQDLSKISKTRKGFTVVEWGGKEVSQPNF